MMFADRDDAGRQLAHRLRGYRNTDAVVLALPRGGVPVGFQVAQALGAPLDLVLVRKIGAPFQEELALGAIADGDAPELVLNEQLAGLVERSADYLDRARRQALQEIERRRQVYLGGRPAVPVQGRTAIVVDDGIATGATMIAALRATRRRHPRRLVLAVPVAPRDAVQRMAKEADETVYLAAPANFMAVGNFYQRFDQLEDSEVVALLERARGFAPARAKDTGEKGA